jgi:uncharacterized protein (TIGR03067 family)
MFWAKAVRLGLVAVVFAAVGVGVAVGVDQAVAAAGERTVVGHVMDRVHGTHRDLVRAAMPTDKDKFQGEWKVVSVKVDGQDGADKLPIKAVTFDGDKVKLGTGGDGKFKLDPAKDPKHLDLHITDGLHPGEFPGVYKLDGDELTFHVAHPGGKRPTDFECKEGDKTILIVLERVKK